MARTQDKLPDYLKLYCIEHDAGKYTARDHASWRYVMRRAVPFFKVNSVKGYEEGLAATGISREKIPHIDDVDASLQKFGWGAVPVCGFIPPWAFLEFQARKILPIATDMRTVDHIAYTPAPDIVHEAAGHAPILPDVDYNEYLSYYAKLGTKAIYSKQDLQLYEAVRYLSDIKEKPESSAEEIQEAELGLQKAVKAFTYVSEAAKVGRMSWWTAEYGMVGTPENPKIYGAGLLSSVGESKNAMTDAVKKIPLSIECTEYAFNITEPQPQLFVAKDMKHLHDVLHELDNTLSYRVGGLSAVKKALESEAVTTSVLDSGLEVSGIMVDAKNRDEQIDFIKYEGPVQLCHNETELSQQGISRHPQGFSSPLGRLKKFTDKPITSLSDQDFAGVDVRVGELCELQYENGFLIKGKLENIHRADSKILYMTFTSCTVTRGEEVFFEPEWGDFDLAVGEEIKSIYGGPADRENYGEHEIPNTESTPGRAAPYSAEELSLFNDYQKVRDLRETGNKEAIAASLPDICKNNLEKHPSEWLILLEVLELAQSSKVGLESTWFNSLKEHLQSKSNFNKEDYSLLEHGLELLH